MNAIDNKHTGTGIPNPHFNTPQTSLKIETPTTYKMPATLPYLEFETDLNLKRIVVIGGGFAGIELVKALDQKAYQVIMLDRHNYHTFQPLLYQVATAGLEPDSVAQPLRKVFEKRKNFHFRVATVERIDTGSKTVFTDIGTLNYDLLVVATGTKTNFFGNDSLRQSTFPLKQVPHALDMRSHMLQAFEAALLQTSPEKRRALLNFVIVGGGPTGVELAGALSELRTHVLPNDYPELDFSQMSIYLVEGTGRVLNGMSEKSGMLALDYLKRVFKVNVILNNLVDTVDGDRVLLKDGAVLLSNNVIWAAGVTGNLPTGFTKEQIQRGHRLPVNEFNQLEGNPEVFIVGDVAQMKAGKDVNAYPNGHPQLAPVAIQQGQHVGKNLNRLAKNTPLQAFSYFNKGVMATVGRSRAVVDLPFGNLTYGGFMAWLSWMFIHLLYLVGFRNKAIVFTNWVYNFFTYDRGTRLIIRPFIKYATPKTSDEVSPSAPLPEPDAKLDAIADAIAIHAQTVSIKKTSL
jgi:NADH:ubiquinone reductase (H+-translocating)